MGGEAVGRAEEYAFGKKVTSVMGAECLRGPREAEKRSSWKILLGRGEFCVRIGKQ